MPEITHLLAAAARGDRQAAADLLPLVYDELWKLAAARMAAERPGHTLDATALVHEAYLRLVGDQHFDGKVHFFTAAAEAMRRVLVNRAWLKRGGGRKKVDVDRLTSPAVASDDDLLQLDDALDRLANEFPVAAELVKLRFFAGMSLGEAAHPGYQTRHTLRTPTGFHNEAPHPCRIVTADSSRSSHYASPDPRR